MADEEVKTAATSGGTAGSSVMMLGVILICILAVFMVTSLNKMKSELVTMNKSMQSLVDATNHNTLAGYRAVDADGKVMWRFEVIPMQTLMGAGGMGGGCAVPPPTE